MDNKKRIENLKEEKYLVLFGVRKKTFDTMLAILERAYEEMRKRGGRKRKLSVLDMLIITLGYYHDYRTMENVAWVEQILIKDGTFSLPSKCELVKENTTVSIAIIVVTERNRASETQSKGFVFG